MSRKISTTVEGSHVVLGGDDFYRISNYDHLRPFFISMVSAFDHWLFISSAGALTAGRGNPDAALFPYYTDDKIHDSAEITGGKTIILVQAGARNRLWEPLAKFRGGPYRVERNLYKNFRGNKLIFEERNLDLGLTFRQGWFNSERFGLVRRARLENVGRKMARVNLLDGIQNILPAGVGSALQLEKSTLVDAYKKSELLPKTGLGLFTLSSIPIDRPEPAEALRATVAWSAGLPGSKKLLSSRQLHRFREEGQIEQEEDVRAERGAYFVQTQFDLTPQATVSWLIAAEVNQGAAQVANLEVFLRRPATLVGAVEEDIERGTRELTALVARADGLQKTASPLRDARHFNNVLFNVMRGGIFIDDYQRDRTDFEKFVHQADHSRSPQARQRLSLEYLPLTFSRRHGDPSRPWNRFSIAPRGVDGKRALNYEGNWRDIFQNWEALALSFPGYVAAMIAKFANASTLDGYNPYRIARDGIDWEVVDPHDPWSHIGYWGDHQLIYLLKLLEILQRHEPATLRDFLARPLFAYANVPYRIADYDGLLKNPKETVRFDNALEQLVQQRARQRGGDGKLVWGSDDRVIQVNLTEKMLVAVLAKLSNFVPEAGIWLNTQRPEWNDANNALVGHGVSVVTLHHLRRYLAFCVETFRSADLDEVELSEEVQVLLTKIAVILQQHRPLLKGIINDRQRKNVLDALGRAGSDYRRQVYASGLLGRKTAVGKEGLLRFFDTALAWVDHSIRANRRKDGLYHSYNLISLGARTVAIRRLYEMLEGQVAALSSGALSTRESLVVLRAVKKSLLYRADQDSYLLYPDREIPRFVDKNNIPAGQARRSKLLRDLMAAGNTELVERDVAGQYHFAAGMINAQAVDRCLDRLAAKGYERLIRRERALVLEIFETVFDHQSFTGRSGTFFGYEGLGCIYWHMVSKLLLAAQETCFRSTGRERLELIQCYHDIRRGLGDCKTPAVYGAFPMDPYSHTPGQGGARQPGLTGQVKEDILGRWGELGVSVQDGQIRFQPELLRRTELLTSAARWTYYNLNGEEQRVVLEKGSLGFTYCQTPIIYRASAKNEIVIFRKNRAVTINSLTLDAETSRAIFKRSGEVARVLVSVAIS